VSLLVACSRSALFTSGDASAVALDAQGPEASLLPGAAASSRLASSGSASAGIPPPTPLTGEGFKARSNYEVLTAQNWSPCVDAGSTSLHDVFGCTEDTDCSVSRCGALNAGFYQSADYQRRVHGAGCEAECAGHLAREAACQNGTCVVPSDTACSPGLFADAGSTRELEMLLPLPDAEAPPEQRLFVIPAAQARGAVGAQGYWTPVVGDVLEVASVRLPAALLASCDRRARSIAPRLDAYRAQFIGVVQGGRRRILGNYLCSVLRGYEDLSVRWLQISDGGECYFHFWYDPQDKSVHDILINGYG
jgi:hypothetical protein